MPHDFQGAPQRATATKVTTIQDDRLPGPSVPKFIYAAHPNSWEYHDEYGFIPRVKKVPLMPGVNGCQKGPNGVRPVLTKLQTEGWIILDENGPIIKTGDDGDLVKDQGYLYKWEGKRGPIYQDAWATPSVLGFGPAASVDWTATYDRVGFAAWRRMLVDKGIVPKPSAGTLSQLLKIQSTRANRRVHESHDGNPHVQAQVKDGLDRLAAMENAAKKMGVNVRTKGRKTSQKPKKANV